MLSWRLPQGGTAVWTSRAARRRGWIDLVSDTGEVTHVSAAPATIRRLRRVNWVAATAFVIGGSLFALGAALAQSGVAAGTTCWIYLFGGVFFSTGGYASLLQAINGPRALDADGVLAAERWRWWAREPERLEWLSAAALFLGTLVFGVLLVDSFIEGLSGRAEDRLVWSPDMIGCILFLVSGQMAIAETCHRAWCWRRRDLGWWIVPSTSSALSSSSSPRSPPSRGRSAARS